MATLKNYQTSKQGVKLTIPAEKNFLSFLRLIIAGLIRDKIANDEVIDDLNLVITEFIGKAIEQEKLSSDIEVIFYSNENEVQIEINNIKEFNPNQLFNSEYLNFETILTLVDKFNFQLNGGKQGRVIISKQINLASEGVQWK